MDQVYKIIGEELSIRTPQVAAVADLLEGGNTVPFISRYRKEVTGSLIDEVVAKVRDRLDEIAELNKRRGAILKSLTERDLLTTALQTAVNNALSLPLLEDIYLPHRPKRRTRAEIAREKGLEPLAQQLFDPKHQGALRPESFVSAEKEVSSVDDALAGARDIIAEWISEDGQVRAKLRDLFTRDAVAVSSVVKAKKEQGEKFADYFDRQEPVGRLAGHRLLAMLRGEREKILRLSFKPVEEKVISLLERRFVLGAAFAKTQLGLAVGEAYKRLLAPSLEMSYGQP